MKCTKTECTTLIKKRNKSMIVSSWGWNWKTENEINIYLIQLPHWIQLCKCYSMKFSEIAVMLVSSNIKHAPTRNWFPRKIQCQKRIASSWMKYEQHIILKIDKFGHLFFTIFFKYGQVLYDETLLKCIRARM